VAAREVKAAGRAADAVQLDELRSRVASRFRSLAATRLALRAELHAATDWRAQARRHPLWAATLAGGVGVASAILLRRGQVRVAVRLLGLVAAAAARRFGRRLGRELSATRRAAGASRP
jgi:hypothetical protein